MSGDTLNMQLRSAKLRLLLNDLAGISAALDDAGQVDAAVKVGSAILAIENEGELLVAEGWR